MSINGFGAQFLRGDGGSPEVFDAIANITEISPPSFSRKTVDVTSHDSNLGYAEFVGGLRDAGEVSLTLNYDPLSTEHNALLSDLDSDDPRNYQITFPTTPEKVWQVSALVISFAASTPRDGVVSAKVGIKITGKPTFV